MLKRFMQWVRDLITPATQPAPKVTTIVITRLSPEVYAKLESQLPRIGKPGTENEAAYLVGVQHVLAALRTGFIADQVYQ
jgi:hypothetical protein